MADNEKKILNFGSININHVYKVDHLVRPGETIPSLAYNRFAGGKGGNQSLALARAGARVFHAGKIGADGIWVKELLEASNVNTSFIEIADGPTGHAMIQVDKNGENAIVIHGGANQKITGRDAERILGEFSKGDALLLQNEISSLPEIMKAAAGQGLEIYFNPAPMQAMVRDYPLELVACFILNRTEGRELTGQGEPEKILHAMRQKFPKASVVLTLGDAGAHYRDQERDLFVPAKKVAAVDTTAAGDTFIGYFLAEIAGKNDPKAAMQIAARAAAICVTRPGAADSIPWRKELEA